jgi:hypothetical protein
MTETKPISYDDFMSSIYDSTLPTSFTKAIRFGLDELGGGGGEGEEDAGDFLYSTMPESIKHLLMDVHDRRVERINALLREHFGSRIIGLEEGSTFLGIHAKGIYEEERREAEQAIAIWIDLLAVRQAILRNALKAFHS